MNKQKIVNIQRLILSGLIIFTLFNVKGEAQINKAETVCNVKAVDFPGKYPVMWGGLYAAKSGKVYIGLCTEGESAHFYENDPINDNIRCIADMAEFNGERGKGIRAYCREISFCIKATYI